MAIVQCPVCQKRISSLAKVCPHCEIALGEMTPERRVEIAQRKRQRHLKRAKSLSLLALVLAFAGALIWWFGGGQGWQWPPPMLSVVLLVLGMTFYLIGRGWLLWLYLTRSTVKRLL